MVALRQSSEPGEFGQILARAESAAPRSHRRIEIRTGGRTWIRAAQAKRAEPEHLENLFVKANYDWADPLNTRSFAAWRGRLKTKRDSIQRVQNSADHRTFYRVSTATEESSLHFASLTLSAEDWIATQGTFRFDSDQTIQLTDLGEDTSPNTTQERHPATLTPSQVTAADELHVLAALNEIGADVNDPLTINFDGTKTHVVVNGIGIPPQRQVEIRQKLLRIPRTIVDFVAHRRGAVNGSAIRNVPYGADSNSPGRHFLEERAGGPPQFESITAQASSLSASLLSQAHALLVLAITFPTRVETDLPSNDQAKLMELRRQHTAAIHSQTHQLAGALQPLLSGPASNLPAEGTDLTPGTSWQTGAGNLYKDLQQLDETVASLSEPLASRQLGEQILARLANELQTLRTRTAE